MSFGTDAGRDAVAARPSTPSTTPSRTASCSSRPPPTTRSRTRATRRASLQPTGTGPDLNAGQRPVGHGRRLPRPRARRSPGAARRSRSPPTAPTTATTTTGRRGSSARSPSALNALDTGALGQPAPVPVPHDVQRRRPLRLPAGHVDGGADGRRGGRARAPPQPGPARGRDRPRCSSRPRAARPGTGWTPDLGWGILDAGAALAARAGRSTAGRRSRRSRRMARRTHRTRLTLRWRGGDQPRAGRVRGRAVARVELWRSLDGRTPRRLLSTPQALDRRVRLQRGHRYRFFTIAVDKAGNRELAPRRRRRPRRLSVARHASRRARRPRGRWRPRRRRRPASRRASATSSSSDASIPSATSRDVGQRVVVAEQAEVHLAVVGHDRDRQRVVLGQERDGEDVLELAAAHVERELRARGRSSR